MALDDRIKGREVVHHTLHHGRSVVIAAHLAACRLQPSNHYTTIVPFGFQLRVRPCTQGRSVEPRWGEELLRMIHFASFRSLFEFVVSSTKQRCHGDAGVTEDSGFQEHDEATTGSVLGDAEGKQVKDVPFYHGDVEARNPA